MKQSKTLQRIPSKDRSHDFDRLQSPSGKTLQQAVDAVFNIYKWLQFAVADTA